MHKRLFTLGTSLALLIASCAQTPAPTAASDALTITTGTASAPATRNATLRALSELGMAAGQIGGSSTVPLTCDQLSLSVPLKLTASGDQEVQESFYVYTRYVYQNGQWQKDENFRVKITVDVETKMDKGKSRKVAVTPNPDSVQVTFAMDATHDTTVSVPASDVAIEFTSPVPSEGSKSKLDVKSTSVPVSFEGCSAGEEPVNTAPVLSDMESEVTAKVTNRTDAVAVTVNATVTDAEQTTATIDCTYDGTPVITAQSVSLSTLNADGSRTGNTTLEFNVDPVLGSHTLECTASDGALLSDAQQTTVLVKDLTAPVPSAPAAITLLADTVAGGAVITPARLNFTATDNYDSSSDLTLACDAASAPVGVTTSVTCTATDASGNESEDVTIVVNVKVGMPGVADPLNSAPGFQSFASPFKPGVAFKSGSTLPIKFLPFILNDGSTTNTDLLGHLTLTIRKSGSTAPNDDLTIEDLSTGSTVWRFDDGQYVFNLSTKNTWFKRNTAYTAVVTFGDTNYVIASTEFHLK